MVIWPGIISFNIPGMTMLFWSLWPLVMLCGFFLPLLMSVGSRTVCIVTAGQGLSGPGKAHRVTVLPLQCPGTGEGRTGEGYSLCPSSWASRLFERMRTIEAGQLYYVTATMNPQFCRRLKENYSFTIAFLPAKVYVKGSDIFSFRWLLSTRLLCSKRQLINSQTNKLHVWSSGTWYLEIYPFGWQGN